MSSKSQCLYPLTTLPIIAKSSGDFLEIRFSNNNDIKNIYYFNNDPNLVKHASKQILTKEENNWLLKVPLVENYGEFKTIKGVLSINNDENYLIEENFEIGISSTSSISFFQAVIFAFIGGLILNLMPCVFPIISLKILSFVALGNESSHFSAGADLSVIFLAAIEQEYEELNFFMKMFQNTMMKLRYSSIPVIGAPHGYTLGGGCEVCLHCDKLIAYSVDIRMLDVHARNSVKLFKELIK